MEPDVDALACPKPIGREADEAPTCGFRRDPYELACATPLGREAPSAGQAARANVAAYERVAGAPFPESAIATLLAALADPERKMEER